MITLYMIKLILLGLYFSLFNIFFLYLNTEVIVYAVKYYN